MDKTLAECLARAKLGSDLTNVDWEIILKTGEEEGNIHTVLIALKQLPHYPQQESLENLLLSAVCAGDTETALIATSFLDRDLTFDESMLLIDALITTGNVRELCERISISKREHRILLHTALVIGVCRHLHQRDHGRFLGVSLRSWLRVYYNELKAFGLRARHEESEIFPRSVTLLLPGEELDKYLGGLLMTGAINTGHATYIRSLGTL